MELYISNSSALPLHRQIYDAIKRKILSGELKEGDALPTVRGLAKDLRISIITTGRAYRDLERDGFIVTAVGRGSFVAGISDGMRREEKLKEAETLLAEAAEKAAAQAKDQLLRVAAEYDNYRKRSTREADQKFNDGISYAVNQIIPILDTLEMAVNAPCSDENFKKGVTMTLDKAAKAFQTLRVEEIEVLGKPFDPNLMNAVQQVPAQEGQESGTVVTVYQKGYKLGDKIVRHATVVVAE